MTAARSKPVWFWPPESCEPVLVGAFSWEPRLGRFSYASDYRTLEGRLALDPLRLPLTRSTKAATETANNGVFGVFRDASPEGFGLALLERMKGRSLDELDRLEQAPGDSVGAIEIGDDISNKLEWSPPPLQRLVDALEQLPQTRGDGAAVRDVSGLPGTSMGGERPKMTVMHGDHWWLAKLQDRGDLAHYPAREYVAMRLATQCGIEAAPVEFHRAGERELIAVKRFDRSWSEAGMTRHAFASAHTVLHLGRGEVRGDRVRSYPGFAHELRRGSRGLPQAHIDETWALMTRRMKREVLRLYRATDPKNFPAYERDFQALTKVKPTLVIWGDKDPYIAPSFAERFNARKVVHLPVGHWAMIEAPAECAAAIAEFLS